LKQSPALGASAGAREHLSSRLASERCQKGFQVARGVNLR
jgi:hypothetical protein